MASHLSTPHSHLVSSDRQQPQSLYNSLSSSSSSPFVQFTPSPFSRRPKLFIPALKLNSALKPQHVSLQDPILEESQTPSPNPSKTSNLSTPDENLISSSRKHVWVNPKSPRAAKLRESSLDARYSFLIKVANSLNSCEPSEEIVSKILIDGLGETPLEKEAVIVLNCMENPEIAVIALRFFQKKLRLDREVVLFNVTLKVFRKNRNYDGAVLLFDEMLKRGVVPDNFTFSTIISCARTCGLHNKAVELFERMSEFGVSPDKVTYSTMIDAYGRSGNVAMALSLYDRARTEKWRIDVVTFSTLIRIYGVAGNYDGVMNVYQEMKALGVKPNRVVYNTLLDAMGRAKRPWQVKSLYKEMIRNGLVANDSTYAALLRAYCKARYGDDALNVYREMKEKGVELSIKLYNTVLSMCADVGYTDEGIEIFYDLKKSGTEPDSWTYSSMITMYSCTGRVSEAENMLNDMLAGGYEPNIFVLTSLIQGYGKVNRTDDVVRTFDRLLELGITPDDMFCGCLLNVMTQIPKEELGKVIGCIERAKKKLADVVKMLVEEDTVEGVFIEKANELFNAISSDVRKAYCNCLIDLCINLNLLERACELLHMGITLEIYTAIQSRSPSQWSLNLKSLSLGAALTALHVWMSDLSKTLNNGEELPQVLAINTGHGKHKHSDKGLASVFESHLKEMDSPFYEAEDKAGWFLTTQHAAREWLEARKSAELLSA